MVVNCSITYKIIYIISTFDSRLEGIWSFGFTVNICFAYFCVEVSKRKKNQTTVTPFLSNCIKNSIKDTDKRLNRSIIWQFKDRLKICLKWPWYKRPFSDVIIPFSYDCVKTAKKSVIKFHIWVKEDQMNTVTTYITNRSSKKCTLLFAQKR